MLGVFLIASMAVLGVTTLMGIITNFIIVAVNLADKVKGKNLSSSDLILVTLGMSNITFQFTMTANDFVSILWSDLYFSDAVYAIFNALLFLPIFSSFWFTVCLCVYYCLQIVIFTHPFLVRLKLGISKLVPWLLVASVFISMAISIPALWSTYRDDQNKNISSNISSNQSLEKDVPKLSVIYMISSNILGCTLPLVLVAVSNGLIIYSLAINRNKEEKSKSEGRSPRTEARERAARTVGSLLLLYMSFYISEIIMFVDLFPPNSPGFCVCLMVIYIYSPAQSVILILGNPKLRKAFRSILKILERWKQEKVKTPKIIFVTLKVHKTVGT
ncbi:taste receptor type 2 member 40-like [Bombina bombina]|uniref:taste receptor type 2 member 40-like n=1 Tax=Bombina bombina TaxID=8345 RepID=UPI00235AD415|nr:taste receptor type 2 member 40-like [Bombina bombina]